MLGLADIQQKYWIRIFAYVAICSAAMLINTPAYSTIDQSIGNADSSHTSKPDFIPNNCPFFIEATDKLLYSCGTVTVPRDYSQTNGETFELQVAVRKKTVTSDKSPLLYIPDQLGSRVFYPLNDKQRAHLFLEQLGSLQPERDIIIFEQRGAGLLDHYPHCTELYFAYHSREPLNYKQYKLDRETELYECISEFASSRSVDLKTLTFQHYAADVESIRLAMQVKKWSVFGAGHGAAVTLDLLRHYPTTIEHSILDSPHLPGSNIGNKHKDYYHALQRAFLACHNHTECAATYPDLKQRFIANIERLNKHPVNISVKGRARKSTVDALKYLDVIQSMLSEGHWLSNLPAVVDATYSGKLESVSELFSIGHIEQSVLGDSNTMPFVIAYACNSYNHQQNTTDIKHATDLDKQLLNLLRVHEFRYSNFTELCEKLNLTAPSFKPFQQDDFNELSSTLILSRTLNPSNTPENARVAQRLLKNAQLVELPIHRHETSLNNPCAKEQITQHLNQSSETEPSSCSSSEAFTLPTIGQWDANSKRDIHFITPSTWHDSTTATISRQTMQALPALSQGLLQKTESANTNTNTNTNSLLSYRSMVDPDIAGLMQEIGLNTNGIRIIDTGQSIISNELRWEIKELLQNERIVGWLGLANERSQTAYVLFGFDSEKLDDQRLYRLDKPYTSIFIRALYGFNTSSLEHNTTD